ncbi:hypothetical protein [Leptolyngbya sp. KIOST-1]|uniref:hypothetical protein n=1 Tax=Leptolyngbya sp. KIOST-1 TaxID=1229172 RepID=UPI00055E3FCF|nr:hypothetical protein [Leptolyngbya sp. KIOST-1]
MKSTQSWQDYPKFYVSNGSDYSPQAIRLAARALFRRTASLLSAAFQPQFNSDSEAQPCRQTIDPLTGLTIPGIFY